MLVLVLFKGHPGTGKTSVSRRLARQLRWPMIDKDDSKDILMTQPGCPAERDANAFSYSIMLRTARTQLACGMSAILDCPLAHLELYERALHIAEEFGATIVVVECVCEDQGIWKRRLESRAQAEAGSDKAHKPQEWAEIEAIFKRYDGCDAWPKTLAASLKLVRIDTSRGTPEEGCSKVLSALAKFGLLPDTGSPASLEDPLYLNSG